jgi:hypothetical protein
MTQAVEDFWFWCTKRTCRENLTMSAQRGKADIPPQGRDFRF